MADSRKRLVAEIRAVVDGAREVERLAGNLDSVEKQSGKTFKDPTTRLRSGLRGSFHAATSLHGVLVGIGATLAAREIVQAGLDYDRFRRKIEATTDSAAEARDEMEFVRQTAARLGLDLRKTADDYASLRAASKGTRLEGQKTRDIFTSVVEASTALGLSADDTSGALTAIQQIISKGTVSAEELRQQLGERLPGAFQLAARATGMTTRELNKALQQGKLLSEDMLPALARELHNTYGRAAQEASDSAQASFNRFKTSLFDLERQLADELIPELLETTKTLREEFNDPQVVEGLKTITGAFGTLITWVTKASAAIANFVQDSAEYFAKLAGYDGGLSDMKDRLKEINTELDRLSELRPGPSNPNLKFRRERLIAERDRLQQKVDQLENVIGAGSSGGGTPGFHQPGSFNVLTPSSGDSGSGGGGGSGGGSGSSSATVRAGARFTGVRNAAPDAMTDVTREFIRLREEMKKAEDQAGETGDAVSQFAIQAKRNIQSQLGQTLRDALEGDFQHIEDAWRQLLYNMSTEYLASQISDFLFGTGQGFGGGAIGALGGLFAGGGGAAAAAGVGGVAANVPVLHAGGVVGDAAAGRRVPAAAFAGAPRFHGGGVVGPQEMPIIAKRKEEVLTRSDPRHVANGGMQPQVNVRNVNVISDQDVADAMNTPAGEQTVLNIIGRNPDSVKGALG